jgi:mRNA-degrading endonuclease toxin of MazEF toxin-antitoxin module
VNTGMPKRGEIYLGSVLATEARGHEQHNEPDGPRKWVIVSDGRIASRAGLVLACPLTTKIDRSEAMAQFRLVIEPSWVRQAPKDTGAVVATQLLGEQLRVMDIAKRLKEGGVLKRHGTLLPVAIAEIDRVLQIVLNLRG